MDIFPQNQQRLPRRETLGLSQLHLKRFFFALLRREIERRVAVAGRYSEQVRQ